MKTPSFKCVMSASFIFLPQKTGVGRGFAFTALFFVSSRLVRWMCTGGICGRATLEVELVVMYGEGTA